MPAIQKTKALTANQRGYNPLADWQYQYAPFNGLVRIGINTTAAAGLCEAAIFTGSDNILERSPVSAGGTAGVMPAPLNVPYIEFMVKAGDRITVAIDELGGVTPTVNFHCAIDPV
jgi:hypothetical protein